MKLGVYDVCKGPHKDRNTKVCVLPCSSDVKGVLEKTQMKEQMIKICPLIPANVSCLC